MTGQSIVVSIGHAREVITYTSILILTYIL